MAWLPRRVHSGGRQIIAIITSTQISLKTCNARLPKVLCKKEIGVGDAIKFFTEGKTGLIEGMISKRGRPFSAFLLCNAADKRLLGWEFPPREAKPKPAGGGGAKRGRFAKKPSTGES